MLVDGQRKSGNKVVPSNGMLFWSSVLRIIVMENSALFKKQQFQVNLSNNNSACVY